MPSKVLPDGRTSQVTILPFYDRTELIQETLGTLNEALALEILITILVIFMMVFNLRASILISGLLPVAVLMVFIAMKVFGVDVNIVAFSGIGSNEEGKSVYDICYHYIPEMTEGFKLKAKEIKDELSHFKNPAVSKKSSEDKTDFGYFGL